MLQVFRYRITMSDPALERGAKVLIFFRRRGNPAQFFRTEIPTNNLIISVLCTAR
jgi:hypothetical protein